ncbi:cation diffusion facilitator family transporter [Vulcanisaeta sp. JCM 16159]|uniref:cation diffusion facilitator family transporter n=1 Tax=Vulcanisaeta sp. JCM 16159 TaxID=1295371 RepID=UPI001FB33DF9|nr:cation diffusion facilitator family transporter [Vulcanisaeta sp. JCM 16159]
MRGLYTYMSNEKTRVALFSLLASVLITAMNITAWLLTNSLAVLAEAMHTFLDIFVTTITLIAVNVGSKPPDKEHPFGHGKAESIGGLFGSLFIIVAGILIGYESAERIITRTPFSPDVIAIVVMAIAIAIDANRSRTLRRVATKWNSRALEADSYHFLSDVAIEVSVVALMIIGLLMERFRIGLFNEWGTILDALVAFVIVIYFSIIGARIMRTSIDELMDRSSEELTNRVANIAKSVQGVVSVKDIRARRIGSIAHIEVTIGVSDHLGIAEAHSIADNVESAIRREVGPSIVMVHVEPELREKIERALANVSDPLIINIHELNIMKSQSGAIVSMHMVIRGDAKLSDADKAINEVKNIIRQVLPNALVWVHLEPDMKIINTDDVRRIADLVCSKYGGYVGDINVINIEGVNAIHILVYLPQNMNIVEAHNVATEIESEIAKIYSMPHHVTVSVLPNTKAL